MSDISKSVKSYLLTFPALREHVRERIHFDYLPTPAKTPCLVIEELFSEHYHQLSGAAGVYDVDLQITVASHHPTDRSVVAEIVRDKLQGKRGTVGADYVHSCELFGPRVKRAIPGDQHGVRGNPRQPARQDTDIYLVEMVFALVVSESIPTF